MLSCVGNHYVNTPSLDRLASNGVRFERNYCANPVSMPSRFAMVTGRFAGELDIQIILANQILWPYCLLHEKAL